VKISPLGTQQKIAATLLIVTGIAGSCFDFFDIAQGTGTWFAEMAPSWALILAVYCFGSLVTLSVILRIIWRDQTYMAVTEKLITFRDSAGLWRWLASIFVFIFPIWLFQFSVLGIVFQGFFIRSLIWMVELFLFTFLVTQKGVLADWGKFLMALILTGSTFSMFASLRFVSSYPFSLGWSEGNRLWDYSIMFGRERYDYPLNQDIFVLLETGRQFVGGVVFLVPGVGIWAVRLWVAFLEILPYLLLGLVLFRSMKNHKVLWLLLALWTYLFLKQGPIHPPLILSAILVAIAWRNSLWISIPLIVLAGYFTNISRFTWIFAPAIWLVLLEFSDARTDEKGGIEKPVWGRVIALFVAGLFGGLFLPELIKLWQKSLNATSVIRNSDVSPAFLQDAVSNQSLLWYRLLPNSTYGLGILLGTLVATGPLILLLYYFARRSKWPVHPLQKLSILLPLIAFLAVGLVVSAKIGGGGDLHNMDMFFIGLLFSMALAWWHGGRQWLENTHHESIWIKMIITACLVLPVFTALQNMRSYNFIERASWLLALTDAPNERAMDMYPTQAVIDESLDVIQSEVDQAVAHGEVLFIDQRQLLTFGFVRNVPLVPDYDKKVLIERALSENREYYETFYKDLEDHRFSLIIIQPLNTPKKGSNDQFGEENNAWVKWVTDPLLCYYEIHQTLADVNVQLLIPRVVPQDCSKELP
jgi:hypothetical protein